MNPPLACYENIKYDLYILNITDISLCGCIWNVQPLLNNTAF